MSRSQDEAAKASEESTLPDGSGGVITRRAPSTSGETFAEGVIPSRELSIRNDVNPADEVKLGDQVEALVLQKEDADGRLILSKKRAQYERAWGRIEEIKNVDGTVRGPVIEVVKGGLILDIGLRGFLPASLVEMRRVRDLQPYVGKELECRI